MPDIIWAGDFNSWQDIVAQFWPSYIQEQPVSQPAQLLIAEYDFEGYEGEATVIYQDADGNYKLVRGGHCSCYGLEGQWEPEDTSREALLHMAKTAKYGFFHRQAAAVKILLNQGE